MQKQNFFLWVIVLVITASACGKSASVTPTPVLAGSEITANEITMTVKEASPPSDEMLSAINPFGDEEVSKGDYILLTLSVVCAKGEGSTCALNAFDEFTLTNSLGDVKKPQAAFSENISGDKEFSGKATVWLIFESARDEADLLVYAPSPEADRVYFEVP
jgi:hypothetical protein